MKSREGFTLVELLAVVSLIALLSLLVIPSVSNLVNRNKDKLSSTTTKLIYSAVDSYLDANQTKYIKAEGALYCISIQTLVDNGFLEKDLVDVGTGNKISEQYKNYVVKSSYKVGLLSKKYEYEILSTNASIEKCKEDEYTPIPNGKYIGIDSLTYYRCTEACDDTDIVDTNKRNKIYGGIDNMMVNVPVVTSKIKEGTPLKLNVRKGSKYIENFTEMTTTVDANGKSNFLVVFEDSLKVGEYVIEVIDNDNNKATKNLKVYTNPIIIFMGD